MIKKVKRYQSSDAIYRTEDGKPIELPRNLLGTYLDPTLWAYSTLPPDDYENLVEVYKIIQGNLQGRDEVRQRLWIHDIFDDENIPYQVVIKGYWITRKKYGEDQLIYVEEKNSKKARKLIKEFENSDDVFLETPEDDESEENYVNGVLQIKCQSCGKEFDFDYPKCPFCGIRL